MNAWRKQSEMACLAYSLFFIGAIDEDELKEYESLIAGSDGAGLLRRQTQWAANYVPWVDLNNFPPTHIIECSEVEKVQLGVAIVRWQWAAHAVAIINGMILDPDGEGRPQTPVEYLEQNNWPLFTAISEKP